MDDEDEFQEDVTTVIDGGVLRAEGMVVLLTATVLYRPFTLVQMYEAIRAGIPIVSVLVEGGGYDFAQADALLGALESNLERIDPELPETLRRLCYTRKISLLRMQTVLQRELSNVLAIPFRPGQGVLYTDAVRAPESGRRVFMSFCALRCALPHAPLCKRERLSTAVADCQGRLPTIRRSPERCRCSCRCR